MSEIATWLATHWLETVGTAFGLSAVFLQTREKVWNWPLGIVNVSIFFVVFWQSKLYADSVLQLYYLATGFYGWWAWLHGGANRTELHVTRATPRLWMTIVPLVLVTGGALGFVLDRYTDSPVPFVDALLTTTSFAAQWMITRKILENWLVWIVANIVYVPMLILRDLPVTAVQYFVFLILAVLGYRNWKRVVGRGQMVAGMVEGSR